MAVTASDWPSTHATLIGRLRAQPNGAAWNQFAEAYLGLIYRVVRRRGVQAADAEDVTSNVFLAVHRGIRSLDYDPQRGQFRSWLWTVARRELIRHQEKSQRAGRPMGGITDGDLHRVENDAGWIVAFNAHVFQTAIARIRPDFDDLVWQAFELSWGQDLKPAAVAVQLGKSAAWVCQAKFRVKQRLHREVQYLTADIPAFSRDCDG
jgi:RNA polymerase sigma factor (sigma-70 family)